MLLSASSDAEVEEVVDRIVEILCPRPSGHEGRCNRRWAVITTELDAEDAQRWVGIGTREGHY